VLPGIPVLGVVPESSTTWLLLLALLPVSVGVLTGWMLRSRLAAMPHAARDHDGGLLFRLALAVSVAVVTGALAALLAVLGSGSIGPGRLARIGPDAGALAFTVGVEVLVGAAILLLLPRRASDDERREVAASVVPARPALPDPGLDTWRRLAAERPFSHPERPVPTTDTWQAPPTESAEPTIVGDRADPRPVSVDSDATEPIPGFERGGTSDGDERPRRPSVD
jgi:hypothetical protein